MKKHFDILINGKKIKVLNYCFKDTEGARTIVLKTQIKGQDFVIDPKIPTEIVIDEKVVSVDAGFEYALRTNKIEEWVYKI